MKIELDSVTGCHLSAKPGTPAAVRGISLEVPAGTQLAVIGSSGAGKTTLLHLVACALQPTAGRVCLNGKNPWQLSRAALQKLRRDLFLAPQVPPLPPRQRVVTAILAARLPHERLWTSLRSLFYPHDIALAHRALVEFDLSEKLFERVDHLSGGERQRVGLARLLAAQASLWLVDEPLSALDPSRAHQALQALTRSAHERGATLVATLHQVDMALAHFPRIVGLREGTVAFDLPTAEVTPAQLQALYAQHGYASAEDETLADDFAPEPTPAVMYCR